MLLALILIVLAAVWRIFPLYVTDLNNFAPVMALAFCSAVYFRDKRMWAVPFVALTISDLYLDYHYATTLAETWTWPSVVLRLVCFGAAVLIGLAVARRKSWLTLLGGTLAGSLFFYLVTNTDAWVRLPFYAKTLEGWWQAVTAGLPGYPPTIWFFRNTLASDVIFTGVFALAMEFAARRAGQPSLLSQRASARAQA